ncbi:MAG: GtrA family protein [Bacteroidales bacterium]|nr:GtrA family protein [Bacteroidales bacterium]
MKERIRQLYLKYRNFILYGLIGGTCAGIDFVIYTVLCYFGCNHLISNIISTHCGIFCSFLLNSYVNFKVSDKLFRRFLSFYAIGLLGLALSEGMLYLMVDMGAMNKIIAKLITVFVVALVQFFMNKFITFKRKTK